MATPAEIIDWVDLLLEEAARVKERFASDPINWGDLRCVAVVVGTEHRSANNSSPVLDVRIEEAGPSCSVLRQWIWEQLEARWGIKVTDVVTEW